MPEKKFLGRGVQFPYQVNKATGRICMSEGAKSVKESIYLILMTQKTERWMRPEFGSLLNSYTFMDTSLTMLNIMARELKENIMSQEPRIADVTIRMNPEIKPGCLIVSIEYTIIAVNEKDNLVFPFYLNVDREGDETDADVEL